MVESEARYENKDGVRVLVPKGLLEQYRYWAHHGITPKQRERDLVAFTRLKTQIQENKSNVPKL